MDSLESKIEILNDNFTISKVKCNNELYNVKVNINLLNSGKHSSLNDWISDLKSQGKSLASGPMHYSIFKALYNERNGNQNENVEIARGFLDYQFRYIKHFVTSTRVIYIPNGNDRVIHDYGFPNQREVNLNLVGKVFSFADDPNADENCVDALLGTKNLQEATEICEWLSGDVPFLSRDMVRLNKEYAQALILGRSKHYGGFYVVLDSRFCNYALDISATKHEINKQ